MAITVTHSKTTASGTLRLLVSFVVGLVALLAVGRWLAWYLAPLVAWDVAAITYLGWMWTTLHGLADHETDDFALREDPSRFVADGVLTFASVASLVAVGVVLIGSGGAGMTGHLLRVGLGIVSVVISWVLVHTLFMLRYAEAYYRQQAGGVEFDGSHSQPTFRDFAYLAFTMGMTYQVSDTGFQSTEFRSLALRHALLSYLFGTVIVATTINLVAGLSQ